MHALHRHPQHEYVDLDLTCPLEDGPESLRLCSVVRGRPHRRSWYLLGSDGRSYHFPDPVCFDLPRVMAWVESAGYHNVPDCDHTGPDYKRARV